MSDLLEKIKKEDAKGFTHAGKFHADDVFSTALLLYVNPELEIIRGNQVPENFDGIVYDIGRGKYDHHQKDARVRENGIPYAAFGLLWDEIGEEILGNELFCKFDDEFIQPLDYNDNTGEKNELASLIGNFNPSWDEKGDQDCAFFQAVQVAGMILENKFAKYRGNQRADAQVEEYLTKLQEKMQVGEVDREEEKILVMPQFVPCQKRLSETDIQFVIFPSNRGGFCIQPQKKEYSMNYRCCFPEEWLGLENEELQEVSGLQSAIFCHKSGFIMSVGTLEDAKAACKISQERYIEEPVIVVYQEQYDPCYEELLREIHGMHKAQIRYILAQDMPEIDFSTGYGEIMMEKSDWKQQIKGTIKKIIKEKPELVVVDEIGWMSYPVIHALRKKHITVVVPMKKNHETVLMRIPSGS